MESNAKLDKFLDIESLTRHKSYDRQRTFLEFGLLNGLFLKKVRYFS